MQWGSTRAPTTACGRPPIRSSTRVFLHHSTRSDSCPTRSPHPPARDSRFHLPDWRYGTISVGALVGVRSDSPTLNAMEPPPSFSPTPRRDGNGRREAWPSHPAAAADRRYPPRERRVGTPSWGGAILGSLCPPNRQMACLSSSYTARERIFFFLTYTARD